MKTKGALICMLLANVLQISAQRAIQSFNDGWTFEGKPISIPHTWNRDAYEAKDYTKGTFCYYKSFTLDQTDSEQNIYLKFEAISKEATIILNDKTIGQHKGGYTSFAIDITPYCNFGETNTLTIIANNANENIAPISGDFTFFGGIYRDVWLIKVPKQHISLTNYGANGVEINTSDVSQTSAKVTISTIISNESDNTPTLTLVHKIYSPEGELIKTIDKAIKPQANSQQTVVMQAETINKPQLWTPENPQLYRVETTILNNGKPTDNVTQYTGFRWFNFSAEKGFYLNGKPYKLHGVCRHQDQKPIGTALTDDMHRRDMRIIKEMGANFIRTSHYPQDEAVIDECDRIGLLAWEEIPVIDFVPDSKEYANNAAYNLREMIRQHKNHPSIILWGYMNEILLKTLRNNNKEEQKEGIQRAVELAEELEKIVKTEDTLRNSVMAFHGSNSYNTVGLSNITDVVGWNLYNGWYGGDLNGFEKFVDAQHQQYPNHPMIISEFGAGSDARLHSLTPKPFDFSIEYQQKYIEHYLPEIEKRDFISGSTYWNLIDFCSSLRDESMPRINNKGLLYSNRTPKDVYYYCKAMWNTTKMVHIATRDWANRTAITDNIGTDLQPIKIYTNCSSVELKIDGESYGHQHVENCTAIFNVPLKNGVNQICAIGDNNVFDATQIKLSTIPFSTTNCDNLEIAINAGSNCYFTEAESGTTWVPDKEYVKGSWGYIGGEIQNTNSEIHNTPNGPLYQTARKEITAYQFDVKNGLYEVELHFADIDAEEQKAAYLLQTDNALQTDYSNNKFDIIINQQTMRESFAASNNEGFFFAKSIKFIVKVDNEKLEIKLNNRSGHNFINALKIREI